MEHRAVETVTARMRARMTSGESLDKLGDGLDDFRAYNGST